MKGKLTAEELMKRLNADPQFVEARAQREEALRLREAELAKAEEPLVTDLRAAGTVVRSVWDLVNRTDAYPNAIPVLLKHLRRDYPDVILNGIGRALATPEARVEWGTILDVFRAERHKVVAGRKNGLAVALSALADDDVLDDVLGIVHNPVHAADRLFFVKALRRSADPRARKALEDLRDDPDLYKEIRATEPRARKRTSGARAKSNGS